MNFKIDSKEITIKTKRNERGKSRNDKKGEQTSKTIVILEHVNSSLYMTKSIISIPPKSNMNVDSSKTE